MDHVSACAAQRTSLLHTCEDVPKLYHEIDHVLLLAEGCWRNRGGERGTRDALLQEHKVRFTVGMDDPIAPGPECSGRSGTPPVAPVISSPRREPPRTHGIQLAPLRIGMDKPKRKRYKTETIFVSDYVFAESSTLLRMYRDGRGSERLSLHRCAKLFKAVVVLCKLRWLLRLHYALIALAGQKCSLQRMLTGLHEVVCGTEHYPHPPVLLFELVAETLCHRLQEGWPLFLRYVGSIDTSSQRPSFAAESRPATAPHSSSGNLNATSSSSGRGIVNTPASMSEIIDDIFIAWYVQQDAEMLMVEELMVELDFYRLSRPVVHTDIQALRNWQLNKKSQASQHAHVLAAQNRAHHFAALLEMPEIDADCSKDVLLAIAHDIVAHPRTFNEGVRTRITHLLQKHERYVGFETIKVALDLSDEQLATHLNFNATPSDTGHIAPCVLDTLKEGQPRAASAWLSKRETSPLSASLPRKKKVPALPLGVLTFENRSALVASSSSTARPSSSQRASTSRQLRPLRHADSLSGDAVVAQHGATYRGRLSSTGAYGRVVTHKRIEPVMIPGL